MEDPNFVGQIIFKSFKSINYLKSKKTMYMVYI